MLLVFFFEYDNYYERLVIQDRSTLTPLLHDIASTCLVPNPGESARAGSTAIFSDQVR